MVEGLVTKKLAANCDENGSCNIYTKRNVYTLFDKTMYTVRNIIIFWHSCPCYMLRPLQHQHHGGIYKGTHQQRILSNLCFCVDLEHNVFN